MSIHARLNPEAQANLDAQRRASVITSLIIAVLSVILVVLILFFILLPSLSIHSPTIVAYSAGSEEEDHRRSEYWTSGPDRGASRSG